MILNLFVQIRQLFVSESHQILKISLLRCPHSVDSGALLFAQHSYCPTLITHQLRQRGVLKKRFRALTQRDYRGVAPSDC
jgi:hypothetical protein